MNRYKQLRVEAGLTQEELAERLGLSVSIIIRFENKYVTAGIRHLIKYANFFDVSTDYIAGITDQRIRQ